MSIAPSPKDFIRQKEIRIMERITQRTAALAVTLVLALASLAMAAPKSEHSRKYLTISGKVLQVNTEARTLLVSDYWSKKLYLVKVPKGETFRITFGMNMNKAESGISDVRRNDRIRLRCIRADKEHLARLADGREVAVVTVTN
jgi:hypothetical protein